MIAISILVSILLVKTGVLGKILEGTRGTGILGSFIAGMFFTSILTTAPAIVTLAVISHTNSLLLTAFVGALGAVVGDLIIFRFIRDRFSEHLMHLVKQEGIWARMRALGRRKFWRRLTFLVAGLIIASPLPDELGIGLLGFSRTRVSGFIPLSFVSNFAGIVIIGLVAGWT